MELNQIATVGCWGKNYVYMCCRTRHRGGLRCDSERAVVEDRHNCGGMYTNSE